MNVSKKLRKMLYLIGYDGTGWSRKIPIYVIVLGISFITGVMSYIFKNRYSQTTSQLLLATNHVNVIVTFTSVSLQCIFKKEVWNTMLHIIEKGFSKYTNEFSEQKKQLIIIREKDQTKTLYNTGIIMFVFCCFLLAAPGFAASYTLYTQDIRNVDVSQLLLPLTFEYPEGYDVIQTYVVVYVLQSIFLVNMCLSGYSIFGSVTCSLQSIVIDINLLCMDLDDVEVILQEYTLKDMYMLKLRDYANYLITCHQKIIRYIKVATKSMALILTMCNMCICYEICVLLYCAAEEDVTITKTCYCILALSLSLAVFMYCNCGQDIIISSEKLQNSLYKCSLLDKPEWFKKDLQLMMAMANMPLHIKPHGFYILNLNTFASIMNAAYTYFNMLRTLKH